MEVVQTCGAPPRHGKTILAHIGCTKNKSAEATKEQTTNSGPITRSRFIRESAVRETVTFWRTASRNDDAKRPRNENSTSSARADPLVRSAGAGHATFCAAIVQRSMV